MAPDRSEVSLKIRSAIKAKLEELGVYVDEELPDYIMVMVANKKSQDAMTEDLRLFLGRSAPAFTKWLTNILDKLHAISKGGSSSAAESKSKTSAGETEKDSKSSKSDKKHHRKEKKKKDEKEKKATKRSSEHNKDADDKQSHHAKSKKARKEEKPKEEAPRVRSPTETKKLAGEMVAASVIEESVNRMNKQEDDGSLAQGDKKIDDGLPLGADYSSVSSQSQQQQTHHRSPSPKREPIRAGGDHERKRNVVRVKPIMKQETETEQQSERRRPTVAAGVFLRAMNEANRPHQQQSTTRRRVETIDDADDAEKKAASGSEKSGAESDGGSARSEESPETKRKRKKHKKHSRHRSKRRVERKSDEAVDENKEATADNAVGDAEQDVSSTRRVEYKKDGDKEEPQQMAIDDETLIIGADADTGATPGAPQPKFVVTMDGLSESFLSKIDSEVGGSRREVEHTTAAPMMSPPAVTKTGKRRISGPKSSDAGSRIRPILVHHGRDTTTGTMEQSSNGSRPHSAHSHRSELTHVSSHHSRRSLSPPLAPATSSTALVSTVDAEESLMPMQVIHPPISIDLDDDDDDLNDSFTSQPAVVEDIPASPSPDQTAGAKIPERCRFWPECQLGDECSYTHPTTKCKSFPACPFKDKCLYLHPLCRFDSACTRPNCPFTHTAKIKRKPQTFAPKPYALHTHRADIELDKSVKYAPLPVPCKFGGQCTKYDTCPFKHPKMCMYGVMCPTAHCTFMHPGGGPPPALKQKMKNKMAPLKTTKINKKTSNRVANPQPLIDTSRFKWSRSSGASSTSAAVLKSPNSQKSPVAASASAESNTSNEGAPATTVASKE